MSGDEVLIGIDAGTSIIKAVAFDAGGEALASRSRPNAYAELENGGVEQDMHRTLADALAVVAELVAAEPDARPPRRRARRHRAGRRHLAGRRGRRTGARRLALARQPRGRRGARARRAPGSELVYARTGTGTNVCQMRTHLTWMKRHAPALLARAATALHCKDWLYLGLTGERATDPSEGVFTFGSTATRDIDEEVIEALGLGDLPPSDPARRRRRVATRRR